MKTTPRPLACESNPCENGGTCIDEPGGKFKCICKLGFSGKFCTEKSGKILSYRLTQPVSVSGRSIGNIYILKSTDSLLFSWFCGVSTNNFKSVSVSSLSESTYSVPLAKIHTRIEHDSMNPPVLS